jgi:hypothetical protein
MQRLPKHMRMKAVARDCHTHERGAPAAVLTVGVEPKGELCMLWPASEQHACIRMGWRPGVGGAGVERDREGTVERGLYLCMGMAQGRILA